MTKHPIRTKPINIIADLVVHRVLTNQTVETTYNTMDGDVTLDIMMLMSSASY